MSVLLSIDPKTKLLSAKDLSVPLISVITKELRIPELKYETSNTGETEETINSVCDFLQEHAAANLGASLIKTFEPYSDAYNLSPRIYNALFVCDRLADVFYRKANIDDCLKTQLSSWRFGLARILIKFPALLETEENPIFSLVDEICAGQIGWTPEPKRVSQLVVERLIEINHVINSLDSGSYEPFIELKEKWISEQEKQTTRLSSSFERLIKTEQGAASSRYASQFSQFTLHSLTQNKSLPEPICQFLSTSWLNILRCTLLRNEKNQWDKAEELTRRFVLIFSAKSTQNRDSLFGMAEGLVDEMAEITSGVGIETANEDWESIQKQLIMMLQGSPVNSISLNVEDSYINFSNEITFSSEELEKLLNQWFFIKPLDQSSGEVNRLKFSQYFSDSREILWMNHAGMKSMIMSCESFKQHTLAGEIRPIPPCYLLSQVFSETLKGLSKVAKAQNDARERAKVKAQAEVEQLKAAKAQALEEVRLKKLEADKRLNEQRLQVAEKNRLIREQAALKIASELTLGAWVSIVSDKGVENEKFKLVVKINATDKFIFVDKIGLKKIEIKTPELIKRMVKGEIKVLNDGVVFDDTLTRVIGAIRVGR